MTVFLQKNRNKRNLFRRGKGEQIRYPTYLLDFAVFIEDISITRILVHIESRDLYVVLSI